MGLPDVVGYKLSLDEDGRFKLVTSDKRIRYPKVQVLKNRIRVGCITVNKDALCKLINYDVGFVQAEYGYTVKE